MPLAFLLSNWKLVGVVAGSVLLASWLGCERMKLIHEGAQQERQKIEEAKRERTRVSRRTEEALP